MTRHFNLLTCVVELRDYTDTVRSHILYNHFYYSDIPPHVLRDVIAERSHLRVIRHANFSPRVVEWMTTQIGDGEYGSAEDYIRAFEANLKDPTRIWKRALEQLSEEARDLVSVLTTLLPDVALDDLEAAFNAYRRGQGRPLTAGLERLFVRALRELDGSLLSTYEPHAGVADRGQYVCESAVASVF
jgi:hypothetical protein